MSLHVVAELRARPGQEDRLRTALEAMIEPSLAEPGCLSYQPFTNPNDPTHMVVVEEWTAAQALEDHFTTPHFRHIAKVLEDILGEPMIIRRLVAE
ncbi:putative quinol monooxygenase [Nocardia huaxiensis]|uniref:Antibiotic biosynthesis monooxygenase n=1 Tax=Nocardia huaxiensis TaxID=2755382 RepID=A0A7D6ZTT4_9NOCA|nr:putative quinol monooxygenase [Nocardia huaxiensis]QLY33705.1 antibiotic biosynthesis monooxygenase [Nocardia huaxiensis]UFS99372.1 antibiotic biosynthesis monooxygenase [Nocardia huaxiensis]